MLAPFTMNEIFSYHYANIPNATSDFLFEIKTIMMDTVKMNANIDIACEITKAN